MAEEKDKKLPLNEEAEKSEDTSSKGEEKSEEAEASDNLSSGESPVSVLSEDAEADPAVKEVRSEDEDGSKKEDGESFPDDKPLLKTGSHSLKKPSAKRKRVSKEYLPDFPFDFKTVITVLLVLLLLALGWTLIFHPAMRIDHIEINGNYEFSDADIMEALNLHNGDYILKPTLMRSRKLIRSTPYIDGIEVRRSFPSGIVINVTERHKLAYIRLPDGYAAVDEEGVILEFVSTDSIDVRPVLAGLDPDHVVVGQRTDITDSLNFRKLILVLGAVLDADKGSRRDDGYHFYNSVREVRIVSSGYIFLEVDLPSGQTLQVKLAGVENIDDNMQWLLYAIRGGAFDDLPAGSLDMTKEEKIYHAYNS